MSAITWTQTIPSGTSLVQDAPDYLHSLWTSITVGLGESLFWDGSGGASTASRGDLKPGVVRLSVGTASQASFDGTVKKAGRGFYHTGFGQAYAYDSSGTVTAGNFAGQEYGTSHATSQWRELSGVTAVSNATTLSAQYIFVLTSLESSFVTWGVPLLTSSNPAVFARSILNNNGLATSVFIEYLLDDPAASSSATFSWSIIGASKVVL